MPEAEENQKPSVIDVSKFFGGKTLSSANLRVGTQQIKAEPSFIAAPELLKLLEVISTYTEVNKTQVEEIKSIERVREREIVEKSASDNRFYQALSSLKFDVETLTNLYTSLFNTLENDRKLREQQIIDEKNKQTIFASEAREAQKGLAYKETTAAASASFSGVSVGSDAQEEPQQKDNLSLAGLLGIGAAAGLGGLFSGDSGPSSGTVPGGNFNADKLTSLARSVGMPEDKIPQMVAIALAESGGGSNEHFTPEESGGTDDSYGLWQINMLGQMGENRLKEFGISSREELFDPVTNAKAAKKVLLGSGLSAWSTYGGDRYNSFLKDAQKASKTNAPKQDNRKVSAAKASASPTSTTQTTPSQEDGARPAPQVSAVPPVSRPLVTETTSGQAPVIIASTPPPTSSPTKGPNVSPSEDIELFGSTNSEDINVLSSMYQLNLA